MACLLILCIILSILSYLKKQPYTSSDLTIVQINDLQIPVKELYTYVLDKKAEYSEFIQTHDEYDPIHIWDIKYNDDMTLGQFVIRESIDSLIRDNVLYQEALARNITLSTSQVIFYHDLAKKEFVQIEGPTQRNFGITQSLLNHIYEKKTLANLYHYNLYVDALIASTPSTVHDVLENRYKELLDSYQITVNEEKIPCIVIEND